MEASDEIPSLPVGKSDDIAQKPPRRSNSISGPDRASHESQDVLEDIGSSLNSTRNSVIPPRAHRSKSVSSRESSTKGPGRRLSFQHGVVESFGARVSKGPSDAGSTETLRQLRWLRAMGKRHDRTTVHLEKFIRLKVQIDRPQKDFVVVVDKTQTVEYLSHLIEAEYAYKFLLPMKGGEKDFEENVSSILPLECGLLYDAAMVSLRYDDKIEDILDLDSEIHVMNAFEGMQTVAVESKLKEAMESFMEDVDDDTDDNAVVNPLLTAFRKSSLKNIFVTSPQLAKPNLDTIIQTDDGLEASQGKSTLELSNAQFSEQYDKPGDVDLEGSVNPYILDRLSASGSSEMARRSSHRHASNYRTYSMVGTTLDDRLQGVLRNRIALDFFHEFCVDDYTIENLLFWLCVEGFQSCPPSSQHLYAKYIYYGFVCDGAPLRINLSLEVLRDIAVPSVGGLWIR
ncbi:hypothetical protein BC829DRAFT_111774 [Chytridium lagenaria]|nr:hypothetical protein BC829DRAFT_111774 [Chytridium lagenaria]